MQTTLQALRDEADNRALVAAAASDRDSADAWERIGLALADVIDKTSLDFGTIKQRTGLFERGMVSVREAERLVRLAQEAISEAWECNVAVRTPRMADAVSLLDRGQRKLLKECDPKRGK